MAYSLSSTQPTRIHPTEAQKNLRASAALTNDQKCTLLSTLSGLFAQAAALLWQTDPNDLQSALSAVPPDLATYCSTLFPNGVPAEDTAPISTATIVDFMYALKDQLYALTPKSSPSPLRNQCNQLVRYMFATLHEGLGSIDSDLSFILAYINSSCTMRDAKANPASDPNKDENKFSDQRISTNLANVEPLLTAVGFPVHGGMVTLVGDSSKFSILLQHAWTVYLHNPSGGEAKLRKTAANYLPASAPQPPQTAPAAVPTVAPVSPQPAQAPTPKDKLKAIYLSSAPLDSNVKLALVRILSNLTTEVTLCEMLWAAIREAHQSANIPVSPQDFVRNLSLGEDKGTNCTTDAPPQILDSRVSIDPNRDPYRQLDIPAWFKYLLYGGSRVASRVGRQIDYAKDQDEFFTFFNMQDVLNAYLPSTPKHGRYLYCDYTGYLIAGSKARNLTAHNTPDSVDQITLDNLMYYLNGWLGSLEPLCCSTPWKHQAEMIRRKETLVKQFFRALDAVSYRIDAILDYLDISATEQSRVEQLLSEAGLQVGQGLVEVMGHLEAFTAALRSAWDLAQTDWEAGARALHKTVMQTRKEIESQKLNMEALRMDVLLELAKSNNPETQLDAQLEAGKRYWNASPRNAQEAGRWFKAAIRNCPNNPESNYWVACYYLDRDGKAAQPKQRIHSVTSDAEEAISHLRCAAQQGHAAAQVLLGQCYENTQGFTDPDTKAAFDLYSQAAKQQNADGLYHLGRCYEYHIGTDGDRNEAFYCYKEAAMQNHPDAQCAMARFYREGYCVKLNYDLAIQILEPLVEQGHIPAMLELASCVSAQYINSSGGSRPANPERAKALYERAANLGSAKAMIQLATYWSDQDSILWLTRAAEVGDPEGQYLLAQRYHQGKGVEKNPEEAFRWYREAAKQEYSSAVDNLIDCYSNGFGTAENMNDAWAWRSQATPYSLTSAACNVFSEKACFLNDSGYNQHASRQLEQAVTTLQQRLKDRESSVACFYAHWGKRAIRAIVENDDCPGLALARYELADAYERGLGIDPDPMAAFQWYQKAAKLGLKRAICAIGRCYEQGIGVDADAGLAAEWYRKAAEAGHAPAQYEWGRCYAGGIGTEADANLAFEWYHKSAEGGNAQGQYALACCYQTGQGSEIDLQKAHRWYCAAAEQGHDQAALKLAAYFAAHSLEDDKNANLAFYCCKQAFQHERACVETVHGFPLFITPGDLSLADVKEMFRDAVAGIPSEDAPPSMVADLTAEERELIEAVFQYHTGYSHQISWDNPQQTVLCYENAIRLGLKYGLVALGECYERGFGDVPVDYPKAKEYYQQAAALGSATAVEYLQRLDPTIYLRVAEFRHYGRKGWSVDYTAAKYYYQIAASLGSTVAAERLKELEQLGY